VLAAFVFVCIAYLVGTFPTAHLVARRLCHDPTLEGSGNPGATNVYRVAGRRAGLAVAAGNVAKGMVPVGVALAAAGRPTAVACWAAAVVGHVFPVHRSLRGVKGGKGVATAGGGALVLYPIVSVALLAAFFVVVRLSRRASVGSLVMAVGLPVLIAVRGGRAWEVAVGVGVSALVVARHAANIRRLIRRDEPAYRPG
jgi:acyl phosphate:glycerol-3-phosphate acyltransferase